MPKKFELTRSNLETQQRQQQQQHEQSQESRGSGSALSSSPSFTALCLSLANGAAFRVTWHDPEVSEPRVWFGTVKLCRGGLWRATYTREATPDGAVRVLESVTGLFPDPEVRYVEATQVGSLPKPRPPTPPQQKESKQPPKQPKQPKQPMVSKSIFRGVTKFNLLLHYLNHKVFFIPPANTLRTKCWFAISLGYTLNHRK